MKCSSLQPGFSKKYSYKQENDGILLSATKRGLPFRLTFKWEWKRSEGPPIHKSKESMSLPRESDWGKQGWTVYFFLHSSLPDTTEHLWC